MSSNSTPAGPRASSVDEAAEYATADEVRAALTQLTPKELAKLQVVAEIHCQHYGVPPDHMEPGELLNEAFLRSLDLTKKWRKGVKILYHLNRAMENIAGHEVPKFRRKVDIVDPDDDEQEGEEDPFDKLQEPRNADGTVFAIVTGREDLQRVAKFFEDDPPAFDVLECRARGQEGEEIQRSLNLTQKDYSTISKRILRKLRTIL